MFQQPNCKVPRGKCSPFKIQTLPTRNKFRSCLEEAQMRRLRSTPLIVSLGIVTLVGILAVGGRWRPLTDDNDDDSESKSIGFKAPAGTLPASRVVNIDGISGAVLPNGRFITPVGTEISVQAPKPYGMAVSPDGNTLATVNSGIAP